MTHAEETVAGLLRGAFFALPEMKEAERLQLWNDKAALAVAKLRKDHPRAVIVGFTKRGPA